MSDDSRSRVKMAQLSGRIAAEAEREAIDRANRKVFSQEYYAKQAVNSANTIAKQRRILFLKPSTDDGSITIF